MRQVTMIEGRAFPLRIGPSREVNFSNGNAHRLFRAMRIPPEPHGQLEIAEFQRGLIRAKTSVLSDPGRYDILPTQEPGSRLISFGDTAVRMLERIEELDGLLRLGRRLGATHIHWW